MHGRGDKQEKHLRSHEHTGRSARQTRPGGSYSGLWNGDIGVCLFLWDHNHRRGTADQGLPSGALGTQNKSFHQSQRDSGTAL